MEYSVSMHSVHRGAIIARPKLAYVKWTNANSPDGRVFSREYFHDAMALVVLVPDHSLSIYGKIDVVSLWKGIFEEQLRRWNDNELCWPRERSLKIFRQWFSIENYSHVMDSE